MATELLAPAGQPDAGYAALHYGADAVYLGLNRFSARAEAENFSPAQLAEFTAFAHSLSPRRNVYLTLNTLVQNRELGDATDTLLAAAEADVDAVIVQDLGIAKIAREKFPSLALHASTQMAIHNQEGVKTAQKLGFKRATLARELTLRELRRIAENTDIEIETFIHGTLCYSYSGLCLFSSMIAGRSGNRGRCVYTCREATATPNGPVHPFSLKDMALGPRVLDLVQLGVDSLKIEGRKKSPLYVAATVDYYRRILNGALDPNDTAAAEARLQTVFARPWTKLFLDSRHNPAAADPDVVGHRGAPVATLERVAPTPAGPGVVFTPTLPVERHDGVQIDIPGDARPYGFPVDNLYRLDKGRPEPVFAAPAGTAVAVALPEDAPALVPGLPVYLASSQEVKRSYPYDNPKPGTHGARLPIDVNAAIEPNPDAAEIDTRRITAAATARPPAFMAPDDASPISATLSDSAAAFPARDPAGAENAARGAFERTGGSLFRLNGFTLANDGDVFVRPGDWNRLRRGLLENLEQAYQTRKNRFIRIIRESLANPAPEPRPDRTSWSVVVDDLADLAKFTQADYALLDEIVIALSPDRAVPPNVLYDAVGPGKLRFALPVVMRENEVDEIRKQVDALLEAGRKRWMAGNPGALSLLPPPRVIDLAADWPLYVVNSQAAGQLVELNFSSFTLSPEDDAANYREILAAFPRQARLTVYSDLPLFISAACAHAQTGLCRDARSPEQCRHFRKPRKLRLEKSGGIEILAQRCGSVVLSQTPYSLADRLDDLYSMGARNLCLDLRWRPRTPIENVELWRRVHNGLAPEGLAGNFDRGMV